MVDHASNVRAEVYGEVLARAMSGYSAAWEAIGKAVAEVVERMLPVLERAWAALSADMPGVPWHLRETVLRQYAARLNWRRKGRRLSWRKLNRPQRRGAALWWARANGGNHG
jgi:hypothetical protein